MEQSEHEYDFGVKWLAAEMLALGLRDLGGQDRLRRIDADKWMREDSSEPMGFKWCISTCGVSGNLIRSYVHKIIYEGKTFEKLRLRGKSCQH